MPVSRTRRFRISLCLVCHHNALSRRIMFCDGTSNTRAPAAATAAAA